MNTNLHKLQRLDDIRSLQLRLTSEMLRQKFYPDRGRVINVDSEHSGCTNRFKEACCQEAALGQGGLTFTGCGRLEFLGFSLPAYHFIASGANVLQYSLTCGPFWRVSL